MLSDSRIDYNEDKGNPNPMEMNSLELYGTLRSIDKSYREDRDAARYWVEFYKKHAIPFSCLVFSFVGAFIGILSRRSGSGIGIGFSIIIFFIYYIFFMTGQSFAIRGIIHPFIGVWSANVIILLAGCLLFVFLKLSRSCNC